ncbi:HNH endonuclease [Hydrogenophaga sp. NFH-34]|uniref:HNH endonuclease n=1 Tax=Hydrogenophaga sp. NFH-34 TaxID=2744446 RepID=UPI001F44C2B2|nr:HNH endonuclease [Hydrogenophaga sp. NFH-34]
MEHVIDGRTLILDDADDDLIQSGGRLTVSHVWGFARCGQRAVHTLVMGAKHGQRVIALNGNLLDCRKDNLRLMTAEERRARFERMAKERDEKISQAKAAAEPFLAIPRDLGSWGVLKTRCWQIMHRRLKHALSLKHPRLAELCRLPVLLRDLPDWSADQCAAFLESPETG